jgi:hypothetical protein
MFPTVLGPSGLDLACNRNEYQESSLGIKTAGIHWDDNIATFMFRLSENPGSLMDYLGFYKDSFPCFTFDILRKLQIKICKNCMETFNV